MTLRAFALMAALLAALVSPVAPLMAQNIEWRPLGRAPAADARPDTVTVTGTGAALRGLDKVSGEVTDFTLSQGQTTDFGRLRVTLQECRAPAEDPTAEAFAFLVIDDNVDSERLFAGWMLASSPALNPLDHARYDVWVLDCILP